MSYLLPDLPDSVTVTVCDGVQVVTVAGEIDEYNIDPIKSALDLSRPAVVLDLCAVTFFGSAGLALLVETQQAAERNGTVFVVAAAQRAILRPLSVTGVDQVILRYNAAPDALAAVRAMLVG
ncbi:hypothetical protein Lesp02_55910 [Lentzea sp. NBRC 105346]|uniref:STAS domain-containing protein n=1 Tax=Lentzea sp. NBRC 105346 TaxID=3032205 RepID=UPI0024A03B04|nr:STAS domain-containing protein [Lentzea sp. NBRC 105346]GLZ33403.1 hypothetical protein Lesp02_55910 [Lentzea sp. NBRC 105346]